MFCRPRRPRGLVDGTRLSATPANRPRRGFTSQQTLVARNADATALGQVPPAAKQRGGADATPWFAVMSMANVVRMEKAREGKAKSKRASHDTQGPRADTGRGHGARTRAGARGHARGSPGERVRGAAAGVGPRAPSRGKNARPDRGSEAPGRHHRPVAVHARADPGPRTVPGAQSSPPRGGPGPSPKAACRSLWETAGPGVRSEHQRPREPDARSPHRGLRPSRGDGKPRVTPRRSLSFSKHLDKMKRRQNKQRDPRGSKGGSIQKTPSPEEMDFIKTGEEEKISRRTGSVSDFLKNLYYKQLRT